MQTLSASAGCLHVPEHLPGLPVSLTLTGNDPVDGGVVVVPAARQPRKVLHRLPRHRRNVGKLAIKQDVTCCTPKAMAAGISPLGRGLCTALPPECRSAGSRQRAGQQCRRNHQTHHPACVRQHWRTDVLISTCGAPTPPIAAPANRELIAVAPADRCMRAFAS
jgi:hypothetical protein